MTERIYVTYSLASGIPGTVVSDRINLGYHKILNYVDNSGAHWIAEGQPTNSFSTTESKIWAFAREELLILGEANQDSPFGAIITTVQNANNIANYPEYPGEMIVSGDDLSAFWNSIKQTAQAVDGSYEYRPLSQNSNTFVDVALKEAGLPRTTGIVEAGQTKPLNTPGARLEFTNRLPVKNDQCFLADTMIDMWDGSKKPIQDIRAGDWVLSYDKNGKQVPGQVTRTMENRAKYILDFHGVMVTPGHAFYCAEGRFKGQHVPIIDILRDDGAYQKADGTVVRAATNYPVGSLEDQFVWVIAGPSKNNGTITVTDKAQLRLGTKALKLDGTGASLLDGLVEVYGAIDENGFTQSGDNILQTICHWPFSRKLPKPEDYILQRSQLTLNDIYAQGEWDAAHPPQMPMPYAGEAGGSFKQNTVLQASLQASGPPTSRCPCAILPTSQI